MGGHPSMVVAAVHALVASCTLCLVAQRRSGAQALHLGAGGSRGSSGGPLDGGRNRSDSVNNSALFSLRSGLGLDLGLELGVNLSLELGTNLSLELNSSAGPKHPQMKFPKAKTPLLKEALMPDKTPLVLPVHMGFEKPDIILADMRKWPLVPAVQRDGCDRFAGIARPNGWEQANYESNPAQTRIVKIGADFDIIKALREFPKDFELQTACMEALSVIAKWNPEAYALMGAHGAIETMANSFLRFPDERRIQRMVGSFASFADFNDMAATANLERIASTEMTHNLMKRMSQWMSDIEMVMPAMKYFANICTNDKLRTEMLRYRYLEKSVTLMQDFAQVPGLRGQVLWTNDRCFVGSKRDRVKLADAGFIPEVVTVLRDVLSNKKVDLISNTNSVRSSLDIVALFAENNRTHRKMLRKSGIVKELKALLKSEYRFAVREDACNAYSAVTDKEPPEYCDELTPEQAIMLEARTRKEEKPQLTREQQAWVEIEQAQNDRLKMMPPPTPVERPGRMHRGRIW